MLSGLVVGANGQIGTVLTKELQNRYGVENIVASDLRPKPNFEGIFETLDGMLTFTNKTTSKKLYQEFMR